MARTEKWLCFLALAACSGCGGGGDGGAERARENDASGAAQGCSRGEYPTSGEVKFCPDADFASECVPASQARGYSDYYGDVYIRGLSELSDFSCMAAVGNVTIADGEGMADLSGLASLSDFGVLALVENPDLQSLSGLGDVVEMGGLQLENNPRIGDMRGLPAGLSMDSMYIERNPELTTLAGLEDVSVTRYLAIAGNPRLPQCEAERFAARFPGITTVVRNNDTSATCD